MKIALAVPTLQGPFQFLMFHTQTAKYHAKRNKFTRISEF